MSRPLRIEYPGAYYHVMNRGAGGKAIYAQDEHRQIFLVLLGEINEMFSAQTHAYCLMDNHYHLLMCTPKGNLSRVMRHLNGVYTQRYNRTKKTDGPLFRGRYKAILIDADAYLLNVSRYIHRNPVEARIVTDPEKYAWSSYNAYVGEQTTPEWLSTKKTLGMIGQRNQQNRYRRFVDIGIDDDTATFYQKKNLSPILGRESFIKTKTRHIKKNKEQPLSIKPIKEITINDIVDTVASIFQVTPEELYTTPRGRGRENLARSTALYVARKTAGLSLATIARQFSLSHYGSVSGSNGRFGIRLQEDKKLARIVNRINKTINKQT